MDRVSQGGQCGTLQSHWRSAVREAGKDGGPERRKAWEQSVVGTVQELSEVSGSSFGMGWGQQTLQRPHTHT